MINPHVPVLSAAPVVRPTSVLVPPNRIGKHVVPALAERDARASVPVLTPNATFVAIRSERRREAEPEFISIAGLRNMFNIDSLNPYATILSLEEVFRMEFALIYNTELKVFMKRNGKETALIGWIDTLNEVVYLPDVIVRRFDKYNNVVYVMNTTHVSKCEATQFVFNVKKSASAPKSVSLTMAAYFALPFVLERRMDEVRVAKRLDARRSVVGVNNRNFRMRMRRRKNEIIFEISEHESEDDHTHPKIDVLVDDNAHQWKVI